MGRILRSGYGGEHRWSTAASRSALALAIALGVSGWTSLAQAQETAGIAPQADSAAQPDSEADVIVVTGSRIARSGANAPTPVTVIGADRIEQTGSVNVGDVLNQVPAFRPTVTPTTSGVQFFNVGAFQADLRGLGPTRTLVLVNGRRFVPSTSDGTVDLNMIPTILIERSEVVTGGASAAYGSDAVAGVVNLILNNDLQGFRATGSYGQADVGDNEQYTISAAYGTKFGNDRGRFIVGGEYYDTRGTGDCYTRDWCHSYNVILNPTPGVNGLPRNILGPTQPSTMTRGGLIYSGPLAGIQFDAAGQPIPFQLTNPRDTLFQMGEGAEPNGWISGPLISPPVSRFTAFGHADFDVSDDITVTLEASYGRLVADMLGAQPRDTRSITIQRDNAFLPESIRDVMIAEDIPNFVLGKDGADLGYAQGHFVTKTYRALAGLSGKFGGDWTWDAYYQYGRSDADQAISNNRINARFPLAIDAVFAPNGSIACRVNVDSNPANDDPACQPLNPFGPNNWSEAAKAYLYGVSTQSRDIEQQVAAANIQGSLLDLPGGALSVAAGAEFRWDSVEGVTDPISQALGFYVGNGSAISGSRNVKEGYVEVVAPLIAHQPFADYLELNGAVRLTNYSRSGTVTTWKAGIIYAPISALRLRATRSRDIRAANLTELFNPQSASRATVLDPVKDIQDVYPSLATGNPSLRPEVADTLTIGGSLKPFRNLQLSIDYYEIKIGGAIAQIDAQTLVNRCAEGATEVCEFVVRDSDNIITLLRLPFLNLNSLTARGVDAELNYRLPLSDISAGWNAEMNFSLLVNYADSLVINDSRGASQFAGVTGCQTTSISPCVPHWTIDGMINYQQGPASVTVRGHYVGGGVYDPLLVGPEDEGYSPYLSNSVTDNRVPARFYVNVAGSYNIIDSGSHRVQIFGSIDNLLDQDPPPYLRGRGNTSLFDPIGRSYRIGLRVSY